MRKDLLFLVALGLGGAPLAACSDDSGTAKDTAETQVTTTPDSTGSETQITDTTAPTEVAETSDETSVSETAISETSVSETAISETSVTETTDTETSVSETADDTSETVSETTPDTTDTTDTNSDTEVVDGTVVSGTVNLVEAGWTLGHCAGTCVVKLTMQGATLALEETDHSGNMKHAANGIFTTGAAGELESLVSAMDGKTLLHTYGCPGCTDGAAFYMTFTLEDQSFVVTYDRGDLPDFLTRIDEIIASALSGLEACTGNADVVISGVCPNDF